MNQPLEKILVVHNRYQVRGGEDSVVEAETQLLRAFGHDVNLYSRANSDISAISNIEVARESLWSRDSAVEFERLVREFSPSVVHLHNTFPLVSPSVIWRARRMGVRVVHTLHNFRLLCANALLLRNGAPCVDCVGRSVVRGVLRSCYRDSFAASAVVAVGTQLHRALGTWKMVDSFIVPSEFARNVLMKSHMSTSPIVVKPNFTRPYDGPEMHRSGVLYVGRLSEEKGISVLLAAACKLPKIIFKVVGEAPMSGIPSAAPNVVFLGPQSSDDVRVHMASAEVVVVPSVAYESFGLVVLEAFTTATPVIASRIGALPELVVNGESGLLFEPRDTGGLLDCLNRVLSSPVEARMMGFKGRQMFENKFSSGENYRALMKIYRGVDVESH